MFVLFVMARWPFQNCHDSNTGELKEQWHNRMQVPSQLGGHTIGLVEQGCRRMPIKIYRDSLFSQTNGEISFDVHRFCSRQLGPILRDTTKTGLLKVVSLKSLQLPPYFCYLSFVESSHPGWF